MSNAFFEKNKRYIAAAVVLVLVIAVLLVSVNTSKKKNGEAETEATEQSAANFTLASEFETDGNDEVAALITDYLNAYAADDLDTLSRLAVPLSNNEKSYIGVFSQYIENYQNVKCYTKPGLSKGSYLISVSYDLKFYGVDTVAPGLEFYYAETGKDGELYINNLYSSYNLGRGENELDPNIYSVVLKYEQQEDVTALQKQVEDAYNAAIASDPDLAAMLTSTIPTAMSQWVAELDKQSESSEQTTEETSTEQSTEQTADTQDNGQTDETQEQQQEAAQPEAPQEAKVTVIATDVSVREAPSGDGGFIASANTGETYTKLGTEGDWTKIDYMGTEAYIKSEFVQDVTN